MSSQTSNQPENARRDAAVETLLSRQTGMNGSTTPCPEPEILAAYLDHTLDDGENDRWESHFAGCERCQDTLTALANSSAVEQEEHAMAASPAPAVAPAAAPVRQSPKPKSKSSKLWLLGIAAAAAVVAFLVLRPASNSPSQAPNSGSTQTAQNAALPPVTNGESEYASTASADQGRKKAPVTPTEPKVNVQQAAEEPSISLNPVVTPDVNVDGLTPAWTQVPNNHPAAGVAGGLANRAVAGGRIASSAGAPAAPASAGQQANPNELSDNALQQANAAPLVNNQLARQQTTAAAVANAESSSVLVFPLKGNVIWRIDVSGRIEKSSDYGMTWAHQQSGTSAQLIAGSAPDNEVCWLVGNGVILRTTDGGSTWAKVSTPPGGEQIDWTAVYATSANDAHVASIDGRRFATKDGGQTWTPEAQ